MREGWDKRKIGEICEVLNGFAFKSSEYVENGIRVIRITNVQKGFVVDDDPKYYPMTAKDSIKSYLLNSGDLLMSLTGNVGRVGVLQKEMLPAALNQRVACLRIKDKRVLLKYLFHNLNSPIFEQDCINSASGVAQKNMSTEWLKKYVIGIPPIAEQEKIVAELDCLTGIIEKKKQQLEELDKLAQSIFYEMFGDPIKNEKGWKTRPIQEVAPQTAYKGDVPSQNGKYWLLNLDMVEAQTGTILDEVYFDEKEIGGSTTTFNEEMVLYSKLRPYLNKVVLPMKPGYGTSELVPLLPDKSILHRFFLAYLLRSQSFVAYINLKVAGAKMPRVSLDVFRRFPVILPPLDLQNEFAKKIEAIEKQKELIKKSIQETETLFNSRMDYWFN